MTTTYNTPGHICPDTGRIAMTVADAYARDDSPDRIFWRYIPEAAEMGTEPWRLIDGMDASNDVGDDGRPTNYTLDLGLRLPMLAFPTSVVYMQRTKAEREAPESKASETCKRLEKELGGNVFYRLNPVEGLSFWLQPEGTAYRDAFRIAVSEDTPAADTSIPHQNPTQGDFVRPPSETIMAAIEAYAEEKSKWDREDRADQGLPDDDALAAARKKMELVIFGRTHGAAPAPSRLRAVRQGLILNVTQAKSAYDAMCALNNVGGRVRAIMVLDAGATTVTEREDGAIIIVSTKGSETHDTQAAFATAYGLN